LAKRLITIGIYVLIGLILYTQKDWFLAWTHHNSYSAMLVCTLFVALLVFVPAVPFIMVASAIGAGFGVAAGTGITLTGATFGSVVMFCLARTGFQDWARRFIGKYHQIREYEAFLTKRAFLSVLVCRLVPIIPSPVVNIVAGLTEMKFWPFLLATALGKLPMMIVYTLAGDQMSQKGWKGFLLVYGPYWLGIVIIGSLILYKRNLRKFE
jgi:uncharacterized membrane protein YdjX (TVP38/TMEM64 family)